MNKHTTFSNLAWQLSFFMCLKVNKGHDKTKTYDY